MEIHQTIEDGMYGWEAGFLWEKTPSAFQLSIRIHLHQGPECTQWHHQEMQRICQVEFNRYFNHSFLFKEENSSPLPLHTELIFTRHHPHLTATVYPQHGETELTSWYLRERPIHLAHELGHQMGLIDEYVDMNASGREQNNASQVFRDHSLMGNYEQEGWKSANVKLRHGQRIAALVSLFTAEEYTVQMNPMYEVQQGDGLAWIAQRYLGREEHWMKIYEINRDVIPRRDVLSPGTKLKLPI